MNGTQESALFMEHEDDEARHKPACQHYWTIAAVGGKEIIAFCPCGLKLTRLEIERILNGWDRAEVIRLAEKRRRA